VKYAFITEHKKTWPVAIMCRVLNVHSSNYYAHLKAQLSESAQQQAASQAHLENAIRRTVTASKQCYGRTRVTTELNKQGIAVSEKRVGEAMKALDLQCKLRRKYRICTTDSNHNYHIADNILNRQFEQAAPNQAWVCDITYIPTREGWLYAAFMLDLFSRKIVGFALDDTMAQSLTIAALQMAIHNRRPPPGLIHHSDRGSQYCAHVYRDILRACGFVTSMSRKGDCWDNAPAESLNGSFKVECAHRVNYSTKAQAKQEALDYITWYNHDRIHTKIGNMSPIEYEKQWYETHKTHKTNMQVHH
jgi:putative transposase